MDKIKQWERKIESFQNNKELAESSGNMRRAHDYELKIQDLQQRIKKAETYVPIESNERLREIIDNLKDTNESLRSQIEELQEDMKDQNKRIDKILNPAKYEKEEEEPEVEMVECPWCHRKFKGQQGLAAHQRWCKSGNPNA